MADRNPIFFIILGAICTALGSFIPNGVELFNYVEIIAIFNLIVTALQGLGIGLLVGGIGLLIKKSMTKNKN